MKLHDYTPPALTAEAGPESSTLAMVAVYPRAADAEALAVEGGLTVEELHCTLVFLGDADDVDDDAVTEAVGLVASEIAALEGNVGGLGQFAEGPDGVPVIALLDVSGLTLLRERIVDELGHKGIRSPSEHGFLPHMTLTYSEAPEGEPAENMPDAAVVLGTELHFDAIAVVIGDERYDYPLEGARVASVYSIPTLEELAAATENVHERLEEAVPALAASYEAVLRAASRRMARSFRGKADSIAADAGFIPPDEDEVVDRERLGEEMVESASEAQHGAARDVVAALQAEGISFDVDAVFTPDLLSAIGERATFAADQDLRGVYRDVITTAADEGWSIPRASDEIIERVSGLADYRARALARTDLIGLANGGSVHVAQTTVARNQEVYKTWLATDDEATRDSHVDADGQSVLVNESFQVGGVPLPYPGFPFGPPEEVMNCRCTVTYGSSPGEAVVTDPDQPAAAAPDPLANIAPSQGQTEAVREVWLRSDLASESSLPPDEYMLRLEEKLTTELADVDVRIRTPGDVALAVAEDGRFKSQFEVASSRGTYSPSLRQSAEADLFSLPRDLPDEQRPIYGYLGQVTDETGSVGQYGEVVWVLKQSVRERTTWTKSDSLGMEFAPSPVNRPSVLSTSPHESFDPLATPVREWESMYFEAQVHGGVALDDVERVEMYYYPFVNDLGHDLGLEQAEQLAEGLIQRLRQANLVVDIEVKPYPGYEPVLGGSAGEQALGVSDDSGGVEVVGGLLPVASSDHRERWHFGSDRPQPLIEHAHLGGLETVATPLNEEHEVRLASDADHPHSPIMRDPAASVAGARRPEGLPLAADEHEEDSMSTTATGSRKDRSRLKSAAVRRAELADGNGEVVLRDPVSWDATLCVEGEATEDGRYLERGGIAWRDLPLTLMGLIETSEWGHEGAQVAGRMDEILRVVDDITATGDLTTDFGIDTLAPMIADRTVRGVSVDLAVLDYEYRDRETGEELDDDDLYALWLMGEESRILFVVLDGVIVGATVCPMPAIANAEIALAASAGLGEQSRAILAGALEGRKLSPGDVPIIRVFTPFDRVSSRDALFSSAVQEIVAPPRAAFELTEFPGKTPLTVTERDPKTGYSRVFGHIATWDTCHVGIPGVCTTAPRSSTEPPYAYFHTSHVLTEEGETLDVGNLMLGTGHAHLGASRMEATRHYDKPDMVGARVRAYDGEFGIWVSGVTPPELTDSGLRVLRENPPSGDWRSVNHYLELIAVCAVAVPGFPVVASAQANITAAGSEIGISALIASSGLIVPTREVKEALIAAGCGCEDLPTEDEGVDELADLADAD